MGTRSAESQMSALEAKGSDMVEFVTDCPRCGASKVTTDCHAAIWVCKEYAWKNYLEIFAVCRHCHRPSIQRVSQRLTDDNSALLCGQDGNLLEYKHAINDIVEFERVVTLRDNHHFEPPDHLPEDLKAIIDEANSCLSSQCFNAAAAMFRLALDRATKEMLPEEGEPNQRVRRSLGLRIEWLFENKALPIDLKDLAQCLQHDGNDGAHDGTLKKEDADDLQDFAFEMLRRLYTEPARLRLAAERREKRRRG